MDDSSRNRAKEKQRWGIEDEDTRQLWREECLEPLKRAHGFDDRHAEMFWSAQEAERVGQLFLAAERFKKVCKKYPKCVEAETNANKLEERLATLGKAIPEDAKISLWCQDGTYQPWSYYWPTLERQPDGSSVYSEKAPRGAIEFSPLVFPPAQSNRLWAELLEATDTAHQWNRICLSNKDDPYGVKVTVRLAKVETLYASISTRSRCQKVLDRHVDNLRKQENPMEAVLSELLTNGITIVSAMSPSAPTGESRCYLADALFKAPHDGYIRASKLVLNSEVLSASGSLLKVSAVKSHPEEEQNLIELTTESATLTVTAAHRIVVQRRSGPQALSADALKEGEDVLISGGSTEPLLRISHFQEKVAVIELSFTPDEPVEAFRPPSSTILSQGRACPKTRRGRRRAGHQADDIEAEKDALTRAIEQATTHATPDECFDRLSIPDTEDSWA